MDPEKIVANINVARRMLGKPEITLEQYNERLQEDGWNMTLYNASSELVRHDMELLKLRNTKYKDVPNGHPLGRSYAFFLHEEKTKEDVEFNENFYAKLLTWEGTKEIVQDVVRQAANIPPEVFFPSNESEVISNFSKYEPIMEALFNTELSITCLREMKMELDPEVLQLLKSHQPAFEFLSQQATLVRYWGSPYFPILGDEDYPTLLMSADTIGKTGTPEKLAFSIFAKCSTGYATLERTEPFLKKGLMLRNNGQLANFKYVKENVKTLFTNVTEDTVLSEPSPEEKKKLDDALAGDFIENTDVKAVKRAKEEKLVDLTNYTRYNEADGRLIKLFGPSFQFDQASLKAEVYTREKFKASDYDVPENCPFSQLEMAHIALASFTLEGIGDVSRKHLHPLERIAGNYNFCVENMVSGTLRHGVGDVLVESIDLARKNVSPLVSSYMAGDKKPLADALVSALKLEAGCLAMAYQIRGNACYDGRTANAFMDMLHKDPELMAIARESGKLSENEMDTIAFASKLPGLYEEKNAAVKKLYDEIDAGRIPSAEVKKDAAVKVIMLDLLSKFKLDSQNAFSNSLFYKEKEKVYTAEMHENRNDPNAPRDFGAKMNVVLTEQPLSDLFLRLKDDGKLEELEKLVAGSEVVRELCKMGCDKLAETLGLDSNVENYDGRFSKKVREELTQNHALDSFTKTYPITPGYIKYDIDDLEILTAEASKAQTDVHFGSSEYDTVENGIKQMLDANKELEANPEMLTERSAGNLKRCYSDLVRDCNAYLDRKKKQGQLNVDPKSKTGKRIAIVKKVLAFSEKHSEKFAATEAQLRAKAQAKDARSQAEKLLMETLTKETAGPLLKHLNGLAAENNDPVRGEKIVSQLRLVSKFMKENGLNAEDCGLEPKDFQKAKDNILNGGLMKAPKANKDQAELPNKVPDPLRLDL